MIKKAEIRTPKKVAVVEMNDYWNDYYLKIRDTVDGVTLGVHLTEDEFNRFMEKVARLIPSERGRHGKRGY